MKKSILAVAFVAFLASCKKDYTCTCSETDYDLNGGAPDTYSYSTTYSSVSSSNANLLKAQCESEIGDDDTIISCVWDKK
jgi:hypothetical protein